MAAWFEAEKNKKFNKKILWSWIFDGIWRGRRLLSEFIWSKKERKFDGIVEDEANWGEDSEGRQENCFWFNE